MEGLGLSGSQWLFYGGLALMAVSLLLGLICLGALCFTGRKLKKRLEEEYGKPRESMGG